MRPRLRISIRTCDIGNVVSAIHVSSEIVDIGCEQELENYPIKVGNKQSRGFLLALLCSRWRAVIPESHRAGRGCKHYIALAMRGSPR